MIRIQKKEILQDSIFDAGGRLRTSELTTLFDGKNIDEDDVDLWHGFGNGSISFANNKTTLSVTAGQYYVRQQNWINPYFSGKSQLIEETTINFAPQTGLIKRVGYFSSSPLAPYISEQDGFYLESGNDTVALKIHNKGMLVESIDWTMWDNYSKISGIDWNNFNVFMKDFLWLGGTDLRLFMQSRKGGFNLLHTYEHAGNKNNTIINSPNQPLRYEIRSSTGTGSMTFVCGQVSTEGSNYESGKQKAVFSPTSIACNAAGTRYALFGIRKRSDLPFTPVKIVNFGVVNNATGDSGILLLLKNPTLSSSLSYSNYNKIQVGYATNQTVTDVGTVIAAIPVAQEGTTDELTENFSAWLSTGLDNSSSEYIVAYMPITINQSLSAILNYKVY